MSWTADHDVDWYHCTSLEMHVVCQQPDKQRDDRDPHHHVTHQFQQLQMEHVHLLPPAQLNGMLVVSGNVHTDW